MQSRSATIACILRKTGVGYWDRSWAGPRIDPLHPSTLIPFSSGPSLKEALMMNSKTCPDCNSTSKNPLARRDFLQAAAGLAVLPLAARMVHGQPERTSKAETIVGEFHASLSETQRARSPLVCQPQDNSWSSPARGTEFRRISLNDK